MNKPMERNGEQYMLNLRYLLIALVVMANGLEPLIQRFASAETVYVWIYTFHIPMFAWVTGYFAKQNLIGTEGRHILLRTLLQYIIFQSLYSLGDALLFNVEGIKHSFFAPYMLLWFLAGHAFWRLLLISCIKLRVKYPIAVALLIGVVIGYSGLDGVWLGYSRTLLFFPFFAAGYYLDYNKFEQFMAPVMRWVLRASFIALGGILAAVASDIDVRWLYCNTIFDTLGVGGFEASGMRLAIYVLQITASAAFLAWVPRRKVWFTELGKRTVVVFLLHAFIIRLAAASGVYDHITSLPLLFVVGMILFGLTALLAQPYVFQWVRPAIEPSVHWLERGIQRTPLANRYSSNR